MERFYEYGNNYIITHNFITIKMLILLWHQNLEHYVKILRMDEDNKNGTRLENREQKDLKIIELEAKTWED